MKALKIARRNCARWGEQWSSKIAHVYAWTGNPDAVFDWLDKALAINEGGLRESRQVLLLNPLHGDPCWQAYLEKLGISDAQLASLRLEVELPRQSQ